MQNENIRQLIGQYMNDELTPEQQAALLQLLDQHNDNELVDVLREMMEAGSANAAAVDEGLMQASLQRVLAADKTADEAAGELKPAPVVRMQRRWQWVAAAVGILAAAIAGFVLLNKKPDAPVSVAATTHKSDVQPGGNKAMLTLANGQQIVLDSAADGMLTQDGDAQIVKLNNGQLIYTQRGKKNGDPLTYNTLVTPRGGEYKLVLPDGSKVWLNAASSIKYPTVFGDKERSVEITGEAYFEITSLTAKGGTHRIPFIVKLPPFQGGTGRRIEVLGTHFNVNAYSDEEHIKTTLLEGKVKVTGNERQVVLNPGEQARMNGHVTQVVQSVDTDEIVAWTNGMFIFRDQRIEDIMKQISRWYDVEVHYAGKPVQEGFNGTIPRNVPVSKVLRLLELTTLVHFRIEGKKVTVLP
ncbi:FecR family protein [Longitalea luteola]|uniref:FecR family protein n=1 Tax=Longitalea luteola TaxID=2812563 RepID=UPI001A967019|nr:FecR family protein [Longitalea luteola]